MELTEQKELMHLEAQNSMQLLTNYYNWSLMYLDTTNNKNIWDAGAGVGLLAEQLVNRANTLLLTEYSDTNISILTQKFKNLQKVSVQKCDLTNASVADFSNNIVDTIINLDVIEHLKDDEYALKLFYNVLQPNGKLILKTPAHNSLFCDIDRASNHYRRYSKKELKQKLEKAGFKVLKISYMNMIGAVMYFLKGKILKKKNNFSNTFSHKNLQRTNKLIPFLRAFEKIFPVFFGLSVVVMAQKQL